MVHLHVFDFECIHASTEARFSCWREIQNSMFQTRCTSCVVYERTSKCKAEVPLQKKRQKGPKRGKKDTHGGLEKGEKIEIGGKREDAEARGGGESVWVIQY